MTSAVVPKLVTINSALVDSPGGASILADDAVTSTDVDAGVTKTF